MNKYELLDRIEHVMFKMYNAFSNIKLYTMDRSFLNILKKNKSLITKKDTCFVIGNGPSIKNIDLTLLKSSDTFSVNFFYKSGITKDFSATYHMMIDEVFYTDENLAYLVDTYNQKKDTKFIFRHHAYKVLKDANFNFDNAYFTYQKLFPYGDFLKLDLTKNMTACINVIISCIQCAIYMGYKKIYLVGCDFNSYATMKPAHFYQSNQNGRVISMGEELKYYSLAHFHLYALQKYAEKHDIKILNATEGSLIDAFEEIKFDQIFSLI
jgi:hypothetical protein